MNPDDAKICPIREVTAALLYGATNEMTVAPYCTQDRCALWLSSPLTNTAGQPVGGQCGLITKRGAGQ